MGDQLRNDVDAAVGSFAKLAGSPYHWSAWGALLHSVRTGENAFTSVHGQSVWDYRMQHPDEGAVFDAAMTAYSLQVADAVVEAYDFGAFGVIADVAGGRGGMLAAILNSDPRPRGVLFDQPARRRRRAGAAGAGWRRGPVRDRRWGHVHGGSGWCGRLCIEGGPARLARQ